MEQIPIRTSKASYFTLCHLLPPSSLLLHRKGSELRQVTSMAGYGEMGSQGWG